MATRFWVGVRSLFQKLDQSAPTIGLQRGRCTPAVPGPSPVKRLWTFIKRWRDISCRACLVGAGRLESSVTTSSGGRRCATARWSNSSRIPRVCLQLHVITSSVFRDHSQQVRMGPRSRSRQGERSPREQISTPLEFIILRSVLDDV